jgi:D-sedoheptulose 7-phosphate isomerase
MHRQIGVYLQDLANVLSSFPREGIEDLLREIIRARDNAAHVFIFGNGGSAATAAHMACDLSKNATHEGARRIRAVALSDAMPTITAYANDNGYESVFAEQLLTQAEAGDLAIAISGSGKSPNILRALETARRMGLRTVGLTGGSGGLMRELVDVCIVTPSARMDQIEDSHLVIDHVVTAVLKGHTDE